MRKIVLAAVAVIGLGLVTAQAEAAQPGALPPLGYLSRTLPNGLKVYSIRDPGSANVSVQMWYEVGSRDDPRGRSGFAHLFEHLMFKSTRNLVSEQFDRLTEDVGGSNNASTNDDYTNYYEIVPANHLQRLLWAEAERMGSLVIDQPTFASERDVVKEEFRSRVLAAPYGKLFYLYYPQISYAVHPYARPGIGSIADLDAATIDDVRAFHAIYYRPDNAVLVVAGNFDQAQLDRCVDSYFKPIPRPGTPLPRVTVQEPVRMQASHFTVYEANTPLPAVLISYPAPPAASRDSAALEVLQGILSTGDHSRLHQSLVYRDQIASEATASLESRAARGTLAVYAILASGKSAEQGEAALRREIALLRSQPVTAAELSEAKKELLNGALRERETVDGRGAALARAVVLSGDPAAADRRLAAIAAVSASDVQRVARRWLADRSSASVRYLPDEMRKGGAAANVITTASTVQTARLIAPPNVHIWQPVPASERILPPVPGPAIVPAVPLPDVQTLANGLRIVTVEDHGIPLVTAKLVAEGGSAADQAGRSGTATLTSAVMTEGTTTRSAPDIDAAVEALGGSLEADAGWDASTLGLTVGPRDLDQGLSILADVARNAVLPGAEIERQRTMAVDAVKLAMGNPGRVARLAAMRALYGGAAYGNPPAGTAASLRSISRADLQTAYRGAWTPAGTTLVLSGDIRATEAKSLAERYFGNWAASAAARSVTAAPAGSPLGGGVIVVDMPNSGQAAVAVARPGIARADRRYFPAVVANAILGGGFSARLNQEIRIRRGLSYGSGSSIDARRSVGPFLAVTQTRNDAAAEVLSLTLGEMRKLGAAAVPPAEFEARRSSLTGGFGEQLETTEGTADLIAATIGRGLPPRAIETYLPGVISVRPADVESVAAALLPDAGSTIVIVGEAAKFVDQLRKAYPALIVIPIADLNLDSPTLR
ncbi:MAG: pitrilysin family protein [Sphingomicrobium sp.]